eukprot:2857905-Prymnesium_polylepis.1
MWSLLAVVGCGGRAVGGCARAGGTGWVGTAFFHATGPPKVSSSSSSQGLGSSGWLGGARALH